jgi:hypothetical protein
VKIELPIESRYAKTLTVIRLLWRYISPTEQADMPTVRLMSEGSIRRTAWYVNVKQNGWSIIFLHPILAETIFHSLNVGQE